VNFETRQNTQTSQQMKLAPRIIQTMEIMQLPLPALEEKIEQELESNFALELEEIEPEVTDLTSTEEETEFSRLDDFEEQSGADLSDLPPKKIISSERDPKIDAMANLRARQESLSEQLMHQWSFAEVDANTKLAGEVLIELIDADGFLTLNDKVLKDNILITAGLELDCKSIQNIITELQKWLDPPGIAARSLQESLLIQVNVFKSEDPETWNDVSILIESHLEDLVSNRLPKVAIDTGIGLDRVKAAIELMHELTLSPGRVLETERVLPVIPDAFIQFDDLQDKYVVGINSGSVPSLRISTNFETLSSKDDADEKTKHFIQRNINAARWLIEAVDQRKNTLRNIVEIVANRQRDFLESGDAYLRPLPMIEVADILGIHVATVSRAVSDKWVQTPRGIFPLRRFFSGGIDSNTEGQMSWEAVKARLQEIIENENKQSPLSDEALAKELRGQGIDIARRTIVKYRQQLGQPSARLRKQF